MKNKKGFVFIETLVVVSVLTVLLLMTYSEFNSLIVKEKERITYNDPVYLYRTFYVGRFIKDFPIPQTILQTDEIEIDDGITKTEKKVQVLKNNRGVYTFNGSNSFKEERAEVCSDLIPDDLNAPNREFCRLMWDKLNIYAIYLTYNDLGYLQSCKDEKNLNDEKSHPECAGFTSSANDVNIINYFTSLGGSSTNIEEAQLSGLRLIVSYNSNNNGEFCTSEDIMKLRCTFYYATISIGDLDIMGL